MLKKILIAYHRFPPIADDLSVALRQLGFDVEVFYTTDFEHWFYHRIIKSVNRHARNFRLISKGEDIFINHPLNRANHVSTSFKRIYSRYQPDALLVIHGLPFAESYLSNINIPKIGWHLEPRDDLPYLIENAKLFDIYNSYSQHDVDLLSSAGFDSRYLCHAVNPEKFFLEDNSAKSIDVCFVGNWSRWRDEALMAALEVTDNISLYGGYWVKKSMIPRKILRKIFKGEEIIGAELNHLYNSSKVVLNASRSPNSHGLNMRFFEVLATSSVFLTDPVPELEKHFVANKHLLLYRTPEELKQLLSNILTSPLEQDRIRKEGKNLVLETHRYDLMATHLLDQFKEILDKNELMVKLHRP